MQQIAIVFGLIVAILCVPGVVRHGPRSIAAMITSTKPTYTSPVDTTTIDSPPRSRMITVWATIQATILAITGTTVLTAWALGTASYSIALGAFIFAVATSTVLFCSLGLFGKNYPQRRRLFDTGWMSKLRSWHLVILATVCAIIVIAAITTGAFSVLVITAAALTTAVICTTFASLSTFATFRAHYHRASLATAGSHVPIAALTTTGFSTDPGKPDRRWSMTAISSYTLDTWRRFTSTDCTGAFSASTA